MAKRAKATKKAASRPRAEQAEPFFRPFSKLNAARSRKITEKKAADRQSVPAPARGEAKRTQRPPPPREGAAPPSPADAQSFALYMAGVRALPDDRAHRIPRTASKLERAPRG